MENWFDIKIEIELTGQARDFIAREAYDPVYGARPLRRYLQARLETPLAKEIIAGRIMDGQAVHIDVGDQGLVLANTRNSYKRPP